MTDQGRSDVGPFVRVLVDAPLMQPLDYRLVGAEGAEACQPGARCVVPLGRRSTLGIVVSSHSGPTIEMDRIRSVTRVLDDIGPLDLHWLELTRFAAGYYQYPWGEVALTALPSVLRKPPGPRQGQVLQRLRELARRNDVPRDSRPALTEEQRAAVTAIQAAQGFAPMLLFGVTGSGKTEVYVNAIEHRLGLDPAAQVLLLVPEINLTPQLERELRARFADRTVVSLHSGLAQRERAAAWLAAHEGRAQILIGTRLAIFASLPRLALVVVDEEHDSSYKAGEGLRFSARDLALKRAQMLGIPIVLGSATPSLETWHRARADRLQILRLTRRAGAPKPPLGFDVVDSRAHAVEHGIAAPAAEALRAVFARGEQSLVFLNRRGYAPVVGCEACGWLSNCPRCSTYAVFHKPDRSLRCHHCGWTSIVPRACPTCGNPGLRGVGSGTQRIEEALRQVVPGARIDRIDRDSMRRRSDAAQAFDRIHRGETDVLVGTQMIAKGHDFRRVSLVLVLGADGQLVSQDFRAPERLFATLMQVAGRAGRGDVAGNVLVQTRFPTHSLFAALAQQDYAAFADAQLRERSAARMPPFVFQALLTSEARSMDRALEWLRLAKDSAPEAGAIRLFDPIPRVPSRVAGNDRAQLLIESDQRAALQGFLAEWLDAVRVLKGAMRWQIEVDPLEI